MAITCTIEQGEPIDGQPSEPVFHVSRSTDLHHGMVDDDGYYEDDEGRIHNRYADIEASSDESPYLDHLASVVGGHQNLAAFNEWASDNLDAEQFQQFEDIVTNGSFAEIEAALLDLYQLYDSSIQPPIETLVYESYPEYQQMTEWARYNLPADVIREYDNVMDNGTPEHIAECVDQLARLYYQA